MTNLDKGRTKLSTAKPCDAAVGFSALLNPPGPRPPLNKFKPPNPGIFFVNPVIVEKPGIPAFRPGIVAPFGNNPFKLGRILPRSGPGFTALAPPGTKSEKDIAIVTESPINCLKAMVRFINKSVVLHYM